MGRAIQETPARHALFHHYRVTALRAKFMPMILYLAGMDGVGMCPLEKRFYARPCNAAPGNTDTSLLSLIAQKPYRKMR